MPSSYSGGCILYDILSHQQQAVNLAVHGDASDATATSQVADLGSLSIDFSVILIMLLFNMTDVFAGCERARNICGSKLSA